MENFFIYAATGTEDNVKLATLVREWLENSSVSRMTLVVVGELGVTAHPVGEYMNGAAYFDFPNTTQKRSLSTGRMQSFRRSPIHNICYIAKRVFLLDT